MAPSVGEPAGPHVLGSLAASCGSRKLLRRPAKPDRLRCSEHDRLRDPAIHGRLHGANRRGYPSIMPATASAPSDIKIVDVDTHLTEPHDLWTSRAPKEWVDRVPRVSEIDGEPMW